MGIIAAGPACGAGDRVSAVGSRDTNFVADGNPLVRVWVVSWRVNLLGGNECVILAEGKEMNGRN